MTTAHQLHSQLRVARDIMASKLEDFSALLADYYCLTSGRIRRASDTSIEREPSGGELLTSLGRSRFMYICMTKMKTMPF